MKVCMCRERCQVACCSKLVLSTSVAALLDELTALCNGQLMNNELVPSSLKHCGICEVQNDDNEDPFACLDPQDN